MHPASDDPLYSGELRARSELTFAAILRAMLVVLPITIVANQLGAGNTPNSVLLGLVWLYVGALVLLQRRGHFALCVHGTVFGLIVFSALIAAVYGSVRSAGTLGQVVAITIGALFLPRRSMVAAAALSIGTIALLIYGELAGLLPQPSRDITTAHWLIYAMIIAATALVLSYMRAMLIDLVRQLGNELLLRKEAEASRQQSEDRFRRVFESSPIGMTITRISDGRFLDVNRADQRTLGYQREEQIGRTTVELGIWPSQEERNFFVAALRERKGVRGYEAHMRHKSGEIVLCRIFADLVELDGEECIVSSAVNVSEQERAEILRRQSEAKYVAVFNCAPDPIAIARERDAVQLDVNYAWLRVTGIPRERAVGRSALEIGLWADTAQRDQVLAQLSATGAVDNATARFRIASGQVIDVLLSAIRVSLDGEPCVVWSWREVTQLRLAQAQERQIRAKFQGLFDISPEGIGVTRWKDAVLIEANDAALAQIGLAREQAVGRSTLELGIGASKEDNAAIFAQLAAEGRVVSRSTRFRRHDGVWLEFQLSAATLVLDGEKCVVWSWRDQTEQLKHQRVLDATAERLRKVFQNSPAAIALLRFDPPAILDVNEAYERLFGWPRDEAVGRDPAELNIWVDAAERARFRERVLAEGRVADYPSRARRRSGELIDTLNFAEIVEEGGERLLLVIALDITERKRAEEARRQALESFAAAFTNTPDGIVISRLRDAVIVDVNQAWLATNGFTREQVVGRTMVELGVWSEEERNAYIDKLRSEGRITNFLATLRRADGRLRQTLLSAIRIERDGEPCVMSMGRDITEMRRIEAERRQALARFDQVFSASPDSMSITRVRDNVILAVNDAWVEANGYARKEVVGRPAQDLGHWKPGEREAVIAELQAEGRVRNRPATLRRADGTYRHALMSVARIEVDGEPCTLFMGRDITSQKAAEEALRDSEHRYRSLFQAAMDCILVVSPGGTIIDANDYGCRSLGYAREDLLGGSFAQILDESKLSRMLPRPPHVKQERRTLRAEQELRSKDGSLRSVEFTAGPLPDGNVLIVVRDVTERRRNDKLLENIARGVSSQTGAEFFRTLVKALCRELPADTAFIGELTPDGDRVRTIACWQDGRLVDNFEYPLSGTPCKLAIERRGTVVHPAHAARDFPEDQGLAQRGIEGYAGTSLYDAEGRALGIVVALTRAPIERKDFMVSMLEIFAARAAAEIERSRADAMVRELNISLERRVRERTAELEAANRDLDSFGYSVSHDLRSPLGALNGFAHLLRAQEAERLSPDGVHLLRQLETNATRMTKLVEGLLEFSRLGRKPVTRMPVPMAALVNEVVEDLRADIGERKVDFRIGVVPETYGDPMLLRQVWKNLIGNAVKYTRKREHAIIEIGFEPAGKEYFVRDNGAGFDMQYAERLFGVFERLHSESEFEGTGVGLAIVQRIVRRHGGVIRGEGWPDRGATFRFTIPER